MHGSSVVAAEISPRPTIRTTARLPSLPAILCIIRACSRLLPNKTNLANAASHHEVDSREPRRVG
jgi:hypothetical protein